MTTRNSISFMFFIKRTKLLRNGQAPIFVRIRDNKDFAELSILKSVRPEIWIAENGHASGNSKEAKEINSYIERTRYSLTEHVNILRDNGKEVSAKTIRDAFLGKDSGKYLIEIFSEHNRKMEKLLGKDFTPPTLWRYNICLKHVKEYIKMEFKKEDILLNDINHEFITGFEFFLKTEHKCCHNTAIKYVKNFKKIIRVALANEWIIKDPFSKIKLTFKKVEKFFLTEEELKTIIDKKFHIERLQHVKDIFIFGCFTGLAYVDIKKLTPENLVVGPDGKKWINTMRTKTGSKSNIPLLPITEGIIEKYHDDPYCVIHNVLLPVLSNQKLNSYLKEIADICGINKPLTTHIARHTFATTVTLNNDIPIETVSKMLGHSSIKMTQTYARLLDKKVGQDMEKLHVKYAGMT